MFGRLDCGDMLVFLWKEFCLIGGLSVIVFFATILIIFHASFLITQRIRSNSGMNNASWREHCGALLTGSREKCEAV